MAPLRCLAGLRLLTLPSRCGKPLAKAQTKGPDSFFLHFLPRRSCLPYCPLRQKSRSCSEPPERESSAAPRGSCRCTDQLDFVWHAPHIEQVHFRPRCRGVSHDQSTVQLASKMMPLFFQACDYPQSHLQSLEAASSALYGMTTLHAAGVCDCSIGADTDFVASSSCWV